MVAGLQSGSNDGMRGAVRRSNGDGSRFQAVYQNHRLPNDEAHNPDIQRRWALVVDH